MTDMVPLRDVVNDHHGELTRRLDRIEHKIDAQATHTHPEKVSWMALIPMGLTVAGLIITLS